MQKGANDKHVAFAADDGGDMGDAGAGPHVYSDSGEISRAVEFADADSNISAFDKESNNNDNIHRHAMGGKDQEDPIGIDELKGAVSVGENAKP